MQQRKFIDCRQTPSERNCSLRVEGTEDEVLDVVARHAVQAHGHADTPELREHLRQAVQDVDEQSAVDVVRLCLDAFVHDDLRTLLDHVADEVEWECPVGVGQRVPIGGRRTNRREVEDFFATLADTMDIQSFEPRAFIAQGNSVVVTGHYRGAVRRTGRPVESDWTMIFGVRDGKITLCREFTDTAALLAAFGAIAVPDQPSATEVRRRGRDIAH